MWRVQRPLDPTPERDSHIISFMTQTQNASRVRSRVTKAVLAVGFVAVAVAVVLAHNAPATQYELSLYDATPMSVWSALGVALVASLLVSLLSGQSRTGALALVLGGTVITVISALPLIRGYHFYGAGDSLTHLAWTKQILGGSLDVFYFLYPGTHTISSYIYAVTGVELTYAISLMVVAFVVVYLLFIPLTVRTISPRGWAVTIAAFAGFLLLPITNISSHVMAHPTTQAVMFFPVILFLFARFLTSGDTENFFPITISSIGFLLALSSIGIVLIHPQQAANVIAFFVAISGIQFVYRRFRSNHPISKHRSMYAQTGLIAGFFVLWAPRHERFGGNLGGLLNSLLGNVDRAAEIPARAVSLSMLGGSLTELFVKLFLASAVFTLLGAVLVATTLLPRLGEKYTETSAFIKYFAFGSIPVIGLFAAYFFGNIATMYFRHFAFLMVISTILGTLALTRTASAIGDKLGSNVAKPALAVFFAALLVLSIMTIYPSPFIYRPTQHVTEAGMSGYDMAFDNRMEGVEFAGIRGPPERYVHVQYGVSKEAERQLIGDPDNATAPSDLDRNLRRHYDQSRYLAVTSADRVREGQLYKGFGYSAEGLASLDSQPGVHRVQSNGGLDLYYVQNETRG